MQRWKSAINLCIKMLTATMVKLSASQWMLPVEGNGEMARAIRMLQKKVFQMENDLHETSVEDEEILDRMSYDPNVNVFGNEKKSEYKASMECKAYQGKAKDEGPRYFMFYMESMITKHCRSSEGMWQIIKSTNNNNLALGSLLGTRLVTVRSSRSRLSRIRMQLTRKTRRSTIPMGCSARNGTVLSALRNQHGSGQM